MCCLAVVVHHDWQFNENYQQLSVGATGFCAPHALVCVQMRYWQVFETNIRIVGGLLSAYALTGGKDAALLHKAVQVADR
jgi:hypothetical protein